MKVRGERERLRKLKAAHAGANAKAWDTSHANLDKELVKFQKFLKSKARRVGEEEVLQVKKILRMTTDGYPIRTPVCRCAQLPPNITLSNIP